MNDFISMGGYGLYVWSAFAIVLGVMGLYAWWSIKRYYNVNACLRWHDKR